MNVGRWLLVASILAACHRGGSHPQSPANAAGGFPRCLAADVDGNQIMCPAPPRTYDGDGCVCATAQGRAFYGRVQEYPR